MFRVDITEAVQPTAEVEELSWIVSGARSALALAPLTRDHVLPLFAAR